MADLIPPKRGEFFTPNGIPTHRFITWIESLTSQTNTNTGEIVNTNIREAWPWPTQPLASETQEFSYPTILPPQVEFNAVSVTSDYVALSFDFINAKSRSTITLPEFPDANDVIIVRNGDGSLIRLNANGKKINGESTGLIRRKGTALTMQYFIDDDEWYVR